MPLSEGFTADILNAIFSDPAFTEPTSVYMALSSADPTSDGSGFAEITTPASNGYNRQLIGAGDMAAAIAGDPSTKTNTSVITFGPSTAAWSAGAPITHFALFDASTGTTRFLGSGTLTPNQAVTGASQNIEIGAGDFDLSLA